jgi:hypothetical protein
MGTTDGPPSDGPPGDGGTMPPPPIARWALGATVAGDHRIFVAGGSAPGGVTLNAVQAYMTPADYVTAPPLPVPRSSLGLVTLLGGNLLAVGGTDSMGMHAETFLFNVQQGSWSPGPALPVQIGYAPSATTPDGTVVVLAPAGTTDTTVYQLGNGAAAWSSSSLLRFSMPPGYAIASHSMANGTSSRYFVVTGGSSNYYIDLAVGTVPVSPVPLPPPTVPRSFHAMVALAPNRYVILGGVGANGQALTSVETYTLTQASWSNSLAMPKARSNFAAVLGSDGNLYVFGGLDANGTPLSSVAVFDTKTNVWR